MKRNSPFLFVFLFVCQHPVVTELLVHSKNEHKTCRRRAALTEKSRRMVRKCQGQVPRDVVVGFATPVGSIFGGVLWLLGKTGATVVAMPATEEDPGGDRQSPKTASGYSQPRFGVWTIEMPKTHKVFETQEGSSYSIFESVQVAEKSLDTCLLHPRNTPPGVPEEMLRRYFCMIGSSEALARGTSRTAEDALLPANPMF